MPKSQLIKSVIWAAAMIAAALLLKNNPAQPWIETGLVVGALVLVILQPQQSARFR
jgi:hypothetical protein